MKFKKTCLRIPTGCSSPAVVTTIICLALMLPVLAEAEVLSFQGNWADAGFNLISQDKSGVDMIFSVPVMEITEVVIDGEIMHDVNIPGVFLPNDAGAPDLPGTGRYLALPQGAHAELEIIDFRVEVMHDMNVAPAFEIPYENDDSPLKYRKNLAIYSLNADYPAQPVMMSEVHKIRGVDVVIVGVTPFQYNPISGDLTVYKDIHIRLNFLGGNGHFGEDRLRSRWWEPLLRQNLLNYESLPKVNLHPERPNTDEDNVEYLIIVPDDPNFIAWADTLKQWRNEQGIITGITTLTEIGGNNTTLIENYITNAYNNWTIPPVAVLLLSDYQGSGDVYGITTRFYNYYSYSCASDNFYADMNNNDLPDLNIARICAQDNSDLQTMIGKMLDYERNPYTDTGFYDHPLMAGGWQSDRWFIICEEIIYGFMANELGKTPVREYAGYSGGAPSYWSTNSNTYMIVNYFGPGGLGYIPSTPSHLTDWSGNAAGINAAINDGAFLVQHRDHGSETGWYDPYYHIPDLSGLNNNMYPYVFSTNCCTGNFTYGGTCFAEAFHRMQEGALGVHAATNVSFSFVNDTYIWGCYDSMWPDFDPGYGSSPFGEENLRPGFASAAGKYYLQASSWPYNTSNKDDTYYLFHHHGDAFMTLYSEVPLNLSVSHATSVTAPITNFTVTANSGSLIGISQNGEVLGAAEGTGSAVSIPITSPTPGTPMRVTVTKANYYRYIADVSVDGSMPDFTVNLTYNYGSPVPAGGGNVNFDAFLQNNETYTVNFDLWIEIPPQVTPPTVPNRNLTFTGGFSITRPDMNWPIPASWPAGNYEMVWNVGNLASTTVWATDSFSFSKSADDFGSGYTLWEVEGDPLDQLFDGNSIGESVVVSEFDLLGNYPNPFNPNTTISYTLDNSDIVKMTVYDLSGREVATLVEGYRDAGAHEVNFDASSLVSGVYIYRLESAHNSVAKKMLLLK